MKWISVKDQLPEKDGRYLIIEDHYVRWIGISMMINGNFDIPITHWMPLPELPCD